MQFRLIGISKLAIYGLFLNWYVIPVFRGTMISNISLPLYGIAAACFVCDVFARRRGRISLEKEEIYWIVYGILALLTSVFAQNSSIAVDGVLEYAKRLLLIILIAYICKEEKSIKFPIMLLTVVTIFSGSGILTHIGNLSSRLDLTTEASLSINDVGSMMVYGIFAVGLVWNYVRTSNVLEAVIKISAYVVLVSTIFITGSRKSIIAVTIFLVLVVLFRAFRSSKDISAGRTIAYVVVICVAVVIVTKYLLPQMETTALYDRLFGDRAEAAAGSDEGRMELYIWALEDFIKHPIVGLGLRNYAYIHGAYSHSVYAEPLACSGVLSVFYLYPYYSILKKQIRLVREEALTDSERLYQKRMLAFWIAFLFIGIGIPFIYKDIPCIILAMFVASQSMEYDIPTEDS